MKQTIYNFEQVQAVRGAQGRGLGAIRDARARNVRVFFGLWLGLFAFTAVWACVSLARVGFVGIQERVWAQLVVLIAALIFYLSARPLRHHGRGARMAALPVAVSLIACALLFGSTLLNAGRHGVAPRSDAGFWSAVGRSHFGEAFKSSATVGTKRTKTMPPLAGLAARKSTLDPIGPKSAT